jgi:chromosome segregation ATPase
LAKAGLIEQLETLHQELVSLKEKAVDGAALDSALAKVKETADQIASLEEQLAESEGLIEQLQADTMELEDIKEELERLEGLLTREREQKRDFQKRAREGDALEKELEDARQEITQKEQGFAGQLSRAEEDFQAEILEITETLAGLKEGWVESVQWAEEQIEVLSTEIVQLQELNYLLKTKEASSQTSALEVQVRLVEALKTLNELQRDQAEADNPGKFADELLEAEARLKTFQYECDALRRALVDIENKNTVGLEPEESMMDIESLRRALSLEQSKSEEYGRQIESLKVEFARKRSEFDPSELADEAYRERIIGVVRKYIVLDEEETRPGSGLETLLTDPSNYIYRFEDGPDETIRDWEKELEGVEAPQAWREALEEERSRSRHFFQELMALRTYLIAELEFRGERTKGSMEFDKELEAKIDKRVLPQYMEDNTDHEWTITPSSAPLLSSQDLSSLESSSQGSLQSSGLPSVEWDNADMELSPLASKPPVSSIPDLVENVMLKQQRKGVGSVLSNFAELIRALDELEQIDSNLEELLPDEGSNETL